MGQNPQRKPTNMPLELSRAKAVKAVRSLQLLTKDNVVGVGVGTKIKNLIDTGQHCITVFVNQKLPISAIKPEDLIPNRIEDIETDVIQIGMTQRGMERQNLPSPDKVKRWRPVPGGVSGGHYAFKGAGTLGMWVRDAETGKPLLLSCWHVLTNMGKCHRDDPIIQPAWIDGGRRPQDTIALLDRWVDVKMLTSKPNFNEARKKLKTMLNKGMSPPINYVDAALARPISEDIVSSEILDVGRIDDIGIGKVNAQLGVEVVTSGRTTGLTKGRIVTLDVDILVQYPIGIAIFEDQIISDIPSRGGDSGSVVFQYAGAIAVDADEPLSANGPNLYASP